MSDDVARARLAHLLDRYVQRCTPELFGAYQPDITLVPRAADRAAYTLAGIVGFVGDVSGTLLIGASPAVVAASHPLRTTRTLTERMQLDWIGELANQLMGRLKLRLVEHGVELRFSAPISLAGDRMRHVAAAGETHRASFGFGSDQVDVWIDADPSEELGRSELFLDDSRDAEGVEGTLVFL